MKITDVIKSCNDKGVKFFLKDGRLGIKDRKDLNLPSDFLELIKSNREEIIEFLGNEVVGKNRVTIPELTKQDVPTHIPLSYAQERLWFLDRLKGSENYHMPSALRIKGSLDISILEKSLQFILERHEILRTVIKENDGFGYQEVIPADKFSIIRHSNSEKKDLTEFLKERIQIPFDLDKDYMLRVELVKLKANEHILLLVMHHIASDGWSSSIFFKELTEGYDLLSKNQVLDPVALPVQYIDYSIWQRNYLQGELLTKKISYWKNRLEGMVPLELPTDFARPAIQSTRGSYFSFELDSTHTSELYHLSRTTGSTMFITLLGLYKLLLSRYSGQTDICVGTPVANRGQKEIEGLIGFFVNTLALRSTVDPNESFRDYLLRIKESTFEDYEHQDVPFEHVLKALMPDRDQSRTPLFQTLLVLQNNQETKPIDLDALQLEPYQLIYDVSKYDLALNVIEHKDKIILTFEYCIDLFKESTIARMASHFGNLISSIVSNPDSELKNHNILSANEQQELLSEFNYTEEEYPLDKTVLDLFKEQVTKQPNATALVFGKESLTYEELDKQSNKIAHYLLDKGIEKEELVPICIDRSLEMIVGILGIMKAGGAYVPIDSEYPQERISFILEDCKARFIISSILLKNIFEAYDKLSFIDLKSSMFDDYPNTEVNLSLTPKNLIYIIYTSGSTGTPKGVMIEQLGVVNMAYNQIDRMKLSSKDITLQFASFGFDGFTWELYTSLLSGGKMVITTKEIIQDASALVSLMNEEKVTTVAFPPSYQVMLQDYTFEHLRLLTSAGEALILDVVEKFCAKGIDVINSYGPTENTVCITMTSGGVTSGDVVTIGKPLSNVNAYILDSNSSMVPIGVVGELCVSGLSLARGYLNKEALTNEKFVQNPFSDNGSLMYKTGDLALWLADGSMEFVGRKDDQVKIRGYRIELGEIEFQLDGEALINQSVVLVKERSGHKHLVAYVVVQKGFDKDAVRENLKGKLPDYMVPQFYVAMDSFPLNANGKVDKKALPDVADSDLILQPYVAPDTEIEHKLVSIWQELLSVEQVGVHDNFFDLGGHSLLAIRLSSNIRSVFNVELPIRMIFEFPTVSGLAQNIPHLSTTLIPELSKQEIPERIPLSYAQDRLWFLDRLQGTSNYHIPFVFRLKGELDIESLQKSFQQVLLRHEVLRTIIKEEEGVAYQEIIDSEKFKIVCHDNVAEANVPDFIEKSLHTPFTLDSDYMLRVELIKLNETDHILLSVLHHIAADGWSMSIFLQEFTTNYNLLSIGETPNLEPLTIQYKDYSIWQRNYLQGELLNEKLSYWKNRLEGLSPLDLPTDFTRPAIQSHHGAVYAFGIDSTHTEKLYNLTKSTGSSLFMTLLGIYTLFLNRYTSQENICIGTPVANRGLKEIEGLIGFFVNTLTLKNTVVQEESFNDFLLRIKEDTLEAYEHQDVPFERIVNSIVTERDQSRTPLFQTMLVHQNNQEVKSLDLNSIQMEPYPYGYDISKYDLTLNVIEQNDEIILAFDYCTDLFKESTIVRMASHLGNLINAIVADSSAKVSSYKMLSADERNTLLLDFNETEVTHSKNETVLDLFEKQVAENADAVAVVFEEETLTYQQLDRKSNQLAHYLLDKGVKKQDLVPICVERSMEMIIGILGIIKAGAAYVPIDPTYPKERIDFMIDDSKAKIVLTQQTYESLFSNRENIQLLDLSNFDELVENKPFISPKISRSSSGLAYVIYTSGSTGTPKGVVISHEGMFNYLHWAKEAYASENKIVFPLFTSIGFDLTITSTFIPLITGGKLIIYKDSSEGLDTSLMDVLADNQVNCIKLTPSHLTLMQGMDLSASQIETMIVGGEDLKSSLAASIQNIFGENLIIYNEYGPTEATVGCVFNRFDKSSHLTASVPIGVPIANTKTYILDSNSSLVPVGVVGELCISGSGLANGYLNRKKLTKEKFIQNPFSEDKTSLMYKTGDLARWLPDGTMQFIGRKDDQVKIRGYRIELGEIEFQLEKEAFINQSVVLVKERSGHKHLVAYVVVQEGFDKDTVRDSLKNRLPEYMVPQLYVELDVFPLTPNGKVDKKALRDVSESDLITQPYVAPRTEIEHQLVGVWQDLLSVEQVGIHDNFFALGGHSLLAIRLSSNIRSVFNVELPIRTIFEYPTVLGLSEKIPHLSTTLIPELTKQEIPEHIPLSYAQDRLWFLDRLGGTSNYHIPFVFRLKGALDIESLENSFQQVLLRHEVLRTVIKEKEEGTAYQEIIGSDNFQVVYHDNVEEADISNFIEKSLHSPFILDKDYMLRVELIKLNETEHILLSALHHIASDGWSMSIFLQEFATNYNLFSKGKTPNLEPLPVQYKDYSIWQRGYLKGELLTRKLAYWKDHLQDMAPLDLPTDFTRPAIQSINGAIYAFGIDSYHVEGLYKLTKSTGSSLFMTFLGIYTLFLNRYTNQEDICIGTPVANRGLKEIEGLIGFFVNTLALKNTVDQEERFIDFLFRIKEVTLDAYEHQDVPFERVVNSLVSNRDQSRTPLFQTMLVHQNNQESGTDPIGLNSIEMEAYPFGYNISKFDLTLNVVEQNNGIILTFDYCTDLFKESTIIRMASHLGNLISAVVADASAKVGSYSMLSETERKTLLLDFNDTAVAYPKDRTVLDLFEEQVGKSPESVAVVFKEDTLTYRQLDEKSNQLAHYLLEQGVGKEDLIPICTKRSLDMIVGIIGIMKSGAAYVPINPTYPSERIHFILKDTNSKLLVSHSSLESIFSELEDLAPIYTDLIDFSNYKSTKKPVKINPNDLAYIIYTSGTTGQPKGVMIEHRNLSDYILTFNEYFNISDEDIIIQQSSISFDTSIEEIYPILISGGVLVITENNMDFNELFNDCEKYKVNILSTNPYLLYYLNEFVENYTLSLRTVISGGDVLKSEQIDKLLDSGLDVYNTYGPTESTVCASYHKVEKLNQRLPIGKPIANKTIHIVSESSELSPIGAIGELCISGAGLARGYLNLPELTQEKFIPNPFSSDSKSRLYKTGDLARWLPDGTIEFMGRKDEQVSIRGFRIELGEIEFQINQEESVNQSVVVVKERSGHKHLVAYVVVADNFDKDIVRNSLKAKMPGYMVPQLYVVLDEFPLTSNGKVDKRSLPKVSDSDLITESYVAPSTEIEHQLVAIWQDLLGVEQIGVNDNFFSVGGDSIIAIQLVSRAKRAGLHFKVSDIFTHQTVHGMSLVAGSASMILHESGILEGNMELLPIHHQFFEQDHSHFNHYNQSMLLGVSKSVSTIILEKAVSSLVQQHDALRLRYEDGPSGHLAIFEGAGPGLLIEKISSEGDISENITKVCEHYQESLDIHSGELARFVYMETPETESEHRLFMVFHHLAIDGVSWRIIMDDLAEFIAMLTRGEEIELLNKATSYRQWQERLVSHSNGPRLRSERMYWSDIQAKIVDLPQDEPYEGITSYAQTNHYGFSIDKNQTKALLQGSHQAFGTEVNDLLLAALAISLCDWSGLDGVVVALEGHGREELFNDIDLSRTVGWFTTMYPIYLEGTSSDIAATIIRTKEFLRSVPSKGIGYGVMRYLSQEEEVRKRLSGDIDQIVFNYLGQFDSLGTESGIFKGAAEAKGPDINLENRNHSKLDFNGFVSGGLLHFTVSYDSNRYKEGTITTLGESFRTALVSIIELCSGIEQQVLTPHDYGLSGVVSNDELVSFKTQDHPFELSDLYKLSPLQEGLLFHSLQADTPNAYIVQMSIDIISDLEIDHFKRTWELLVDKHSILRTSFYGSTLDVPVQCVYDHFDLPLEVLDYRDKTSEDVSLFLEKDANTPFDLTKAPLFRLILMQLPEGITKFIFTNHHLLLDGWSSPILLGEMIGTYQELLEGKPASIVQTKDNYRDYINHLSKKDVFESMSHWQSHLSGLESASYLPFVANHFDRNKIFGNQSIDFEKDASFVKKLEVFSKNNRVTINTVLQGVWAYLLSKYTGNNTVVYGTVISGRDGSFEDIESRVGLYINTIPLCVTVNSSDIVPEWLGAIQNEYTVSREDYGHSALSEIQNCSSVQGELFDTLMIFENFPLDSVQGVETSLKMQNMQGKEQTNYTLSLTIHSNAEEIWVDFSYNDTVISTEAVKTICSHFETALDSILNSDTLGQIEYLSEVERDTLLLDFNDTEVAHSKDVTILDLFRKQVSSNATAIALTYGDSALSYGALDERSNVLASKLMEVGVMKGDLVAICMDRSLDMIVGIMGVLKSGGAYVPIDPNHPKDRISYILEDTACAILITSSSQVPSLELNNELQIMEIDGLDLTAERNDFEPLNLSGNDLAYVIYTSGSTGRPKGVMVEHNSLYETLEEEYRLLDMQETIHSCLLTNYVFDVSILEINLALCYGGVLVIPNQTTLLDKGSMLGLLNEKKVNLLQGTPSFFDGVLYDDKAKLPHVKKVCVGGDSLTSVTFSRLQEMFPNAAINNHYGPTEITIDATVHKDLKELNGNIIGKPIGNTSVYVLDESLNLLPLGVAGEICISGSGVARGYLNNDALTDKKFVTNPFKEGKRMYRTGDLGRWLTDGSLEFVGRKDDQVKIRGYRIELGEVEFQLDKEATVNQSVVMVHEFSGQRQLVAYVVVTDDFNKDLVRTNLKNKLPDYMVPKSYVVLEAFPLTSNGKVDKKSLPEVSGSDFITQSYVAPSTETEQRLVEIWQHLLGLEKIGIHDNFFGLGGHSMLAIRLIPMIGKRIEIDIPVETIFIYPTIHDQAKFMDIFLRHEKFIADKSAIFDKKLSIKI